MSEKINANSLDTVCAALCYAMGVAAPEHAAAASQELCKLVDEKLQGKKADRIFMYNPDAIAQWIEDKYPAFIQEVTANKDIDLPLCAVMPSVTPVCFGTMYTGAQPAVHGIRRYEKPVIKLDSIFDALIRAGKKPVIVAHENSSLSKIFLEREMDYFIYPTMEEVNAKAAELILQDQYDFYVVYNDNYDSVMHKNGPESAITLGALRTNAQAYATFAHLIQNHWQKHDTLLGFAMDHGCHEVDGGSGSHGLDMEEDLNIRHHYKVYPAQEK